MVKLRKDSAFWKAIGFAFLIDFGIGWLISAQFAGYNFIWLLFLLNPFLLAAFIYQLLAREACLFRAFLAGVTGLLLLEIPLILLSGKAELFLSIEGVFILLFVTLLFSKLGFLGTAIGYIAADVSKTNLSRKLPLHYYLKTPAPKKFWRK
jgi:hypothetical protein